MAAPAPAPIIASTAMAIFHPAPERWRRGGSYPAPDQGAGPGAEPDHGAGWGWYAAPEPGWDADGADPDQAEPEPGSAVAPVRGAGSYQEEKSGGGPSGRAADPAAPDEYPAPAPCPQLLPGGG